MHDYALAHLSDSALLRDLAALVTRDRTTTASLLAHIAEVDARKLYVPAGYPSMFAYCVDELRLSEDAAAKRIHAARAARRFPILFIAIAEGTLHLAGVCLLAPHLTEDNVDRLIQAATHQKKSEIEVLLARRSTAPERQAVVRVIPPAAKRPQHAPGHAGGEMFSLGQTLDPPNARTEHAPGHVGGERPAERYFIQVTVSKETHDKLRRVQALLSHAVRAGDVAQVLDRALDALIKDLEKKKCGASESRSQGRRDSKRVRHIPAAMRRAVWERDQGQCTFISACGKRCDSRHFLEFDHVEPVALGGKATVEGLRLRCRAHNQYEAERVLGKALMNRKRAEAVKSRRARIAAAQARARAVEEAALADALEQSRDVIVGLRSLGCRAEEARRAAEHAGTLPGASVEERMKAALSFLGQGSRRGVPVSGTLPAWESSIGSGKG